MNIYKLIKLKEGYIIISDEALINNDNYYHKIRKTIHKTYDNADYFINNTIYENLKKIIASTFIPELPNIDFNNLEEKFGIVDVEKVSYNWLYDNEENMPKDYPLKPMQYGFEQGFNKCLELNKDKLYTEEDVLDAWEKGAKEGLPVTKTKKDKLLKLLQPKTEWDIEIESETKCYCGHTSYCECEELEGKPYIQRPKITNNKIKILKV